MTVCFVKRKNKVQLRYVESDFNISLWSQKNIAPEIKFICSKAGVAASANYLLVAVIIIVKDIIPCKLFVQWISAFLLSMICLWSDGNSFGIIVHSELLRGIITVCILIWKTFTNSYSKSTPGLKPVFVSESLSGSRCLNRAFSHLLLTNLWRTSLRKRMLPSFSKAALLKMQFFMLTLRNRGLT